MFTNYLIFTSDQKQILHLGERILKQYKTVHADTVIYLNSSMTKQYIYLDNPIKHFNIRYLLMYLFHI